MAIDNFEYTHPNGWEDSVNFPTTPANETQTRQLLQQQHKEVRDYLKTKLVPGVNEHLADFVSVTQFGAKGDGITDDTQAILDALNTNKKIYFPPGVYVMQDRFVLNGHTIKGAFHGDSFGDAYSPTKILFKNMPAVESCVLVEFTSNIENIIFEHDIWDSNTPEIHGLIVNRKLVAKNCGWNAFPGYGVILYRSQSNPDKAPYMSAFYNCTFDFNKKHNIVIGNGCNAVTFVDPHSRWAGATSYKSTETVSGQYDGIYIDGKMAEIPAGFDFEPSGNIIIGGNISYNSRYGINFKYGNDNTLIGGYLEGNRSGYDIAVDSSYSTVILNPMAKTTTPLITTQTTDPNNSSRNLRDFPNAIIIRGRNFGNGLTNKHNKYYQNFISQSLVNGPLITTDSSEKHIIIDKAFGGTGAGQSFLKITDLVHLNAKNAVFGTENPNTEKGLWFFPADNNEGTSILNIINGTDVATSGQWTQIFSAKGEAANTSASAMRIRANETTSRSINAGGTVNTIGADYAEYMYKADDCGEIKKGDICGIDKEGKLTDKWENAISFVVKSTNPSFVGGDTWKEAEREKVDRIAFCGICPVNVYGAKAGDYIIPVQDGERIKGIPVTNPTFEEYRKAVGRVVSIQEDGRAKIKVI